MKFQTDSRYRTTNELLQKIYMLLDSILKNQKADPEEEDDDRDVI